MYWNVVHKKNTNVDKTDSALFDLSAWVLFYLPVLGKDMTKFSPPIIFRKENLTKFLAFSQQIRWIYKRHFAMSPKWDSICTILDDISTCFSHSIIVWSIKYVYAIFYLDHYSDVILSTMASQITSLTIVCSTVYSGVDQRNIKAPCHWPLCGEFTADRWIPRTKGQ